MPPRIDLTGQTFGRLTVVGYHGGTRTPSGSITHRWACRCACGAESIAIGANLTRGHTRSCGCMRPEATAARSVTHGATIGRGQTATYRTWVAMIARCENPARWQFKHYGGRGITVCTRWRESFENFLADVGARPSGLSLDRIDNDRGYEPGNVRWATPREQTRNSRRAHVVEHDGERLPIVAWSDRTGIPARIIQQRLSRGWSAARALSPNDLARKA